MRLVLAFLTFAPDAKCDMWKALKEKLDRVLHLYYTLSILQAKVNLLIFKSSERLATSSSLFPPKTSLPNHYVAHPAQLAIFLKAAQHPRNHKVPQEYRG